MSGPRSPGAGRGRGGVASPIEWMVAAVSALLVLGAAAFLLRSGAQAPSPPRITLRVDSVVRVGDRYLVEFRARNDGRTTASGLTVEGEVRSAGNTVERSQVTLDYVPAGGSQRGGLYFGTDPRRGHMRLRPMGYERP